MPKDVPLHTELTPEEISFMKAIARSSSTYADLVAILEEFDPEHFAPVERRKPY